MPARRAALPLASGLLLLGLLGAATPLPRPSDAAGEEKTSLIEGHARALVDAINAEEPGRRMARLRDAFAETEVAAAGGGKLAAMLGRIHEALGPIVFHHVEILPRAVHLFVQAARTKAWRDLQLRYEPATPWRFTELVFIAEVTEPVLLPNGPVESPEVLAWVGRYIDRLAGENGLSGSLLLVRDGKKLVGREFGFADAAGRKKVTPATRFNLGSGTKMFTAVAIAQLAQAGKLSFDDPVIKYFPDFPDPQWARKATIRHLLTHTSGLGDYWTDAYEKAWGSLRRLSDSLPFVYAGKPSFQPGERFQYSNSGFLLLGIIVEKVSGGDYFDYLKDHVYEPAGMSASGSFLTDGSVGDLAAPLARGEGGWVVARHPLRGTSAGGSFSTTGDILKFSDALRSGALLPRGAVEDLLRARSGPGEGSFRYGSGFMLWTDQDSPSYGHGGLAPGVNFEYRYFPRQKITFVILSNQDNGAYDDLRKNIVKLVTGAR
ncbi:MAG TPA: serine hydrolase domain-containing protein [Candidatus Saccharimonadales bacterium]|nr:serine hydrolase domain-containing protein [Candidatus Saccharimonadales bacterium]